MTADLSSPRPSPRLSLIREAAHRLHEREVICAEQAVISFVVARRNAPGAPPTTTLERALEVEARNRRRMTELSKDPLSRVAGAARALLHRLPQALREPLSRMARQAANPRPRLPGAAAAPSTDTAAAIPFGPRFPSPSLAGRVGVVAHVFYPDLAAEMREHLAHIPGGVDLYVSTDTEAKRDQILRALNGWQAGAVDVRIAANRGRDVAPKLITFRDVYDRHEILLHLHSKKSVHDSDLKLWRDYLYETLMGDEGAVASVLAAFEQRPDLGLVAPQHYFAVRHAVCWGRNLPMAQSLARRMGLDIEPDAPLDFPAGSMFWARSAALRPLLDLQLTAEDFEPEAGQEDDTLAHAVERLYFHACERAGFRWIKIARPELVKASAPSTPVLGPDDLAAVIEATLPLGARRTPGR